MPPIPQHPKPAPRQCRPRTRPPIQRTYAGNTRTRMTACAATGSRFQSRRRRRRTRCQRRQRPVTRPSPPPSRHLRQAPSQADRRARAPCPADPGRLPQTCIGRPTRAAAGRRSGEQGGEAAGVFGHRASRKTRGVTICDPLPALSSLYKPSWPPSASLADSCCLMQPLYPPRPSRSAPVMLRRTEVSLATPDRAC